MIDASTMTNPIAAIKPSFGIYTLNRNAADITALKGFSTINNDVVDRGKYQGNAAEDLSARNLAKQFG